MLRVIPPVQVYQLTVVSARQLLKNTVVAIALFLTGIINSCCGKGASSVSAVKNDLSSCFLVTVINLCGF